MFVYYLAYGSNLNLNQMKYRCPSAKPIGSICLEGYRLVYKGDADTFSYLTIEKCDGYSVPLGLYKMFYFDILSLDFYEGYPDFYYKTSIPVQIGNKTKKALIYIMNHDFDYHYPSSQYVQTCMEGYDDFGFHKDVLYEAFHITQHFIQKKKVYEKKEK